MILETLLNKSFVRTAAITGVLGFVYVSGYYSKIHFEDGIGKLKGKINSAIIETITPEEQVRRNMPLYKKELINNPAKYKTQIIEITCFGVKEYPTDIFVKSIKSGVDYIKKEYNTKKE
jgi:hypothetical protein